MDTDSIIKWIKEYVSSARAKGVVLGMSGGKDSLVTAKLCVDAIGKDNVYGVIMPNNSTKDMDIAEKSCKLLGINYKVIDINPIYEQFIQQTTSVIGSKTNLSPVTTINLAPRIRTNMLYSIAGSLNYLVANTSNLSETMIGYSTKWGDNVGDFSPLGNFTKTEVCLIGEQLGLPHELVYKVPDDGLSGMSDEQKIGFSYDELDLYIRKGIKGDNYNKIASMHSVSNHKRLGVVKYTNNITNYFDLG